MYIRSLYIESFGGMKDREFQLSQGLNIIEGKNESGKSTLCMFIKFMFYSLSGRTCDGEMSERQKYVPWDTGRAAGTLEISTADGDFRIVRELSVSDGEQPRERVSVIELATGEKVFKGKVPGVAILGMDEQMFVNTVFVRQIGSAAIDGTGMTESIENILLSGDESLSLKKALERLDKARKVLMHKRGAGGAIQKAMQEKAQIERELHDSRNGNAQMIELEGESEKLSSLIELRTKERDENSLLCDGYLKLCRGKRAEEGIVLKKKTEELVSKLSLLDRYGNVPEKTVRINTLFARYTAVDSRLAALFESMVEEPDRSDRMTEEDVLSARRDVVDAEKYDKKRKQFLVFGIVFIILGAVFAGIGSYLNFFLELSFANLILAFGGALFLMGIAFAMLCASNAAKLKGICKKWGADLSLKAVSLYVEDRIERAAAYDNANSQRAEKKERINESEEERRKILALLRTASLEFSDEDYDSVEMLCEKALEKAATVAAEREKITGELGIAKGELKGYSDVLGDDDGKAVLADAKDVISSEMGPRLLSFTKKDYESCKAKKLFAENVLPGLLKRKGEVDSLLARLRATTKDLSILSSQLETVKREIDGMNRRLAGIEEASNALSRAGEGLRSSLIPKILSDAGSLMAGFTDGKYPDLCVDGDFSVSFIIDDQKREISYMSSGTADAAYISLRAALARVLFCGDALPLIYDESFARIDETRLSQVLRMLCEGNMQSIVFTCRTLEGDIAGKLSESTTITL